jgi:hypothetical protein
MVISKKKSILILFSSPTLEFLPIPLVLKPGHRKFLSTNKPRIYFLAAGFIDA